MEIRVGSIMNWHEFVLQPQIIPTVLIPLTALSVAISSLAVFIAGLFGIKLKADGPKKLLEVLLKPKILITAAVLNLALWGAYKGYEWARNGASLDVVAKWKQSRLAKASNRNYPSFLQLPDHLVRVQTKAVKSPDVFTLETNWKTQLAKGSFSEPVVSGDSLFVGSDDGHIYELDKSTGEIIRKFYIGTAVTPRVLIFQEHLYAGEGTHDTHHARISKFNLKTGEFVGSFRTVGHIEGQLLIDSPPDERNPILFASGGIGGLYAIDPVTLKLKWNLNVGHNDSGAIVEGESVFFGTGREKNIVDSYRSWAVAAKRSSGEVIWKRELPASSWMLPSLHGKQVCFVFGEVYFKSEIGGIACFDKTSGISTTMYYHNAPIVSGLVIFNDDFILTDFNGKTCRIHSQTKAQKWCQQISEEPYTLAGLRYDLESNSLVKATRKGKVVTLDPETGEILSTWQLVKEQEKKSLAPVLIHDNDFYFIDLEGNLARITKRLDSLSTVRR